MACGPTLPAGWGLGGDRGPRAGAPFLGVQTPPHSALTDASPVSQENRYVVRLSESTLVI